MVCFTFASFITSHALYQSHGFVGYNKVISRPIAETTEQRPCMLLCLLVFLEINSLSEIPLLNSSVCSLGSAVQFF